MSATIISRDEVPAGSFRYGQLASVEGFDVDPDYWAVCTDGCWREDGRKVIVAHFLHLTGEDALQCAANLSDSYRVVIVRPV